MGLSGSTPQQKCDCGEVQKASNDDCNRRLQEQQRPPPASCGDMDTLKRRIDEDAKTFQAQRQEALAREAALQKQLEENARKCKMQLDECDGTHQRFVREQDRGAAFVLAGSLLKQIKAQQDNMLDVGSVYIFADKDASSLTWCTPANGPIQNDALVRVCPLRDGGNNVSLTQVLVVRMEPVGIAGGHNGFRVRFRVMLFNVNAWEFVDTPFYINVNSQGQVVFTDTVASSAVWMFTLPQLEAEGKQPGIGVWYVNGAASFYPTQALTVTPDGHSLRLVDVPDTAEVPVWQPQEWTSLIVKGQYVEIERLDNMDVLTVAGVYVYSRGKPVPVVDGSMSSVVGAGMGWEATQDGSLDTYAHTKPNDTSSERTYLRLNLGSMTPIDQIRIENRRCAGEFAAGCMARMVGCYVKVLNSKLEYVWAAVIHDSWPTYVFYPPDVQAHAAQT